MKYIIVNATKEEETCKIPFVFPDIINHSDMYEYAKDMLYDNYNFHTVSKFSAGFINLRGECFGKSETLNIESHPTDSLTINMYNYTHGLL